MDFEDHIYCHDYDLSTIINWQHFGGGPLWQQIGNKLLPSLCLTSQFSFVVPIFSGFDKINNFWQQKQQVVFLSNISPKVLLTYSL